MVPAQHMSQVSVVAAPKQTPKQSVPVEFDAPNGMQKPHALSSAQLMVVLPPQHCALQSYSNKTVTRKTKGREGGLFCKEKKETRTMVAFPPGTPAQSPATPGISPPRARTQPMNTAARILKVSLFPVAIIIVLSSSLSRSSSSSSSSSSHQRNRSSSSSSKLAACLPA